MDKRQTMFSIAVRIALVAMVLGGLAAFFFSSLPNLQLLPLYAQLTFAGRIVLIVRIIAPLLVMLFIASLLWFWSLVSPLLPRVARTAAAERPPPYTL
jgi:hypothetical protein